MWLATINNEVLGFSHLSLPNMLDHLETQCLSLTDREKAKKLQDIHVERDEHNDVEMFFTRLDNLDKDLCNHYDID